MMNNLYEDVGKVLKTLILIDPYYALFMMSLDKHETDRVPTLAVGLNGINVVLYINPTFWFSLSKDEKYGVCKHEMMHLCFMHLVTGDMYSNHKLDNIATDAEINQYIDAKYLPKFGITLESIQKEFGVTLSPKMGRDNYYKALQDKVPPDYNLGNAEHFWEEFDKLSDADKLVVQNQIDYLVERTADEVRKAQGTVPGEIEGLIAARKLPPKFDWKKHLRRFVGNSREIFLKHSRFKPNPYFPGTPSNKIKMRQNILCIIDTSGSVSNHELEEFMSEIYNIWKLGDTVTILCVDTQIYDPFEYKGQAEVMMKGRGGTYFTPSLEYFNEHKEYSCGIYFTDGYAELPPDANRPFLWVISSNGSAKAIEDHNGKKLIIQK